MAYKKVLVDGFIQETSAALSNAKQVPYVKMVVKQGSIGKSGEKSYEYFTCFFPGHLFASLDAAKKVAERYSPGRHVLVEGRPRHDVSLKQGMTFPLTINSLADLNAATRVNTAVDIVGMPELLT